MYIRQYDLLCVDMYCIKKDLRLFKTVAIGAYIKIDINPYYVNIKEVLSIILWHSNFGVFPCRAV